MNDSANWPSLNKASDKVIVIIVVRAMIADYDLADASRPHLCRKLYLVNTAFYNVSYLLADSSVV